MEDDPDIRSLIEKYEQMRAIGKKIYFDAAEFAALAEHYNAMGYCEEADALIYEGLMMHPGNPELMMLKAETYIDEEMYREALKYMEGIPEDGEQMALLRIEAWMGLGNRAAADKIINDTLNKDLPLDEFYEFVIHLGFLLIDAGFFERAIQYLEESLKINDSNVEALVDLSHAYEMLDELEKAIEYNNRVLDIDPYSCESWVNIGRLYSLNGQQDKAIDAGDFALAINEGDVEAMKMKAQALHLNDNPEEAAAIYEECLPLLPDEGVYESLSAIYAELEQFDKMTALIDRWEEEFGSEDILARRAFVHIYKEEYAQAKALFDQIPEDGRDSYDYFMLEGELAFHDADLDKAEAAYMKAALATDEQVDVIDKLANISVAQEKYEQAAEYLKELLEIDPHFPTAKARLAFIRFEIGSKEPFDDMLKDFSDKELRELLCFVTGSDNDDFGDDSREFILMRLNEARENRVLFKNIKY